MDMFNKFVTGSLTAALLLGGALTTADASSGSDCSTNQLYQNHAFFAISGYNLTGTDSQQQEGSGHQKADDQQLKRSQRSVQGYTSQQVSGYAEQVVELTNEKRTSRGLEPLEMDKALSKVARKKSDDMASNHYFSHNSPAYGSPFDMMKQFNISYKTAGENIAKGQKTPEEVVDGWMHSKGHRENILNSDFSRIGVGYNEDGDYWTQEFTGE